MSGMPWRPVWVWTGQKECREGRGSGRGREEGRGRGEVRRKP